MRSRWMLAAMLVGVTVGAPGDLRAQSASRPAVGAATSVGGSSNDAPTTARAESATSPNAARVQTARAPFVVRGFGVAPEQITAARLAWTEDQREFRQALTRDGRVVTVRPDGNRVERAALPGEDAAHAHAWRLPGGTAVSRSRVVWDQP